jgi:putative YjhG/YagF family dehydratase
VDDWARINRMVPRFVDVLPNGPMNHPTVRLFLAGGVPEIAWHLREMGVLRSDARTVTGQTWNEILDQWRDSPRRAALRQLLRDRDGVDPDQVILPPKMAKEKGMTSTVCFPLGNLCPEGSVIKATSIDPSVVDADGVYRKTGPARVFATEKDAIAAIKGRNEQPIKPGDILVLIGRGPLGSGMEETYQVTSALKHIAWGKHVAVITDARFSGVSTGACIGHVGPEALAGGPIGKLRDGDEIEIIIDRNQLTGSINLIGVGGKRLSSTETEALLMSRSIHPQVRPDVNLPDDTRLWAALQQASGGTWGGCVYDVDRIIEMLEAGRRALS